MWKICQPKQYVSDEIEPQIRVSPWAVNRDFGYDLIRFVQPKKVIELGTFFGCSLFAFMQADQDEKLGCDFVAVDTWQGDIHAGFYDESIYNTVLKIRDTYFLNSHLTLVRDYFSSAVNKFADETFDIIHIDGLHTYEATKENFELYLPKLSKNGIVLFHDVAYENYGSKQYWTEISSLYPSFTLDFSWGLGILFPKGNYWYEAMLKENIIDKLEIYKYRAQFELSEIQNKDLNRMLLEREQVMKNMDHLVEARDDSIRDMEKMIIDRDGTIKSMESMINERDKEIKSMENMIDERDKAMKSMENMIDERDKAMKSMENMIDERDKAIKSMENMIDERDKEIKQLKNMPYQNEEGTR